MRTPKLSEQAIAKVVIAWLEALGADVYQEVACSGGVADIVARVGAEVWIIETKSAFSLALITQAMDRRRSAHRVYIAAPYTKSMQDIAGICAELGIGCLQVDQPDYGMPHGRVTERAESKRWNKKPVALAKKLRPEHKTSAPAGTNAGGHWTPYRDTCRQLATLVALKPGLTLKAAVTEIKHHYASTHSARASLVRWIEAGKVDGVRLERVGTAIVLHPSKAAA